MEVVIRARHTVQTDLTSCWGIDAIPRAPALDREMGGRVAGSRPSYRFSGARLNSEQRAVLPIQRQWHRSTASNSFCIAGHRTEIHCKDDAEEGAIEFMARHRRADPVWTRVNMEKVGPHPKRTRGKK